MLLDIFKQVLKLENLDFDNPLNVNYAVRAINRIVSHPAIILDDKLMYRPAVFYSSNMPNFIIIQEEFEEEFEKVKQKKPETSEQEELKKNLVSILEKGLGIIKKFPNFNDLRGFYEEVKEKFEKNKVSREFPLYFLPLNYSSSLYTVSLDEGIEVLDSFSEIMEYILLGEGVERPEDLPEPIQKKLDKLKRDKFGETKRVESLDELLRKLPEPQTIITDVYIADCFPQLAENGFEAYEFRLPV